MKTKLFIFQKILRFLQAKGLSKTIRYSLFAILALLVVTIIGFIIIAFYIISFLIQIVTSSIQSQSHTLPESKNTLLETAKKYGEDGTVFMRKLEEAVQPFLDIGKPFLQFF